MMVNMPISAAGCDHHQQVFSVHNYSLNIATFPMGYYLQNSAANFFDFSRSTTAYNQSNLPHHNQQQQSTVLTPEIVREYLRNKENRDCTIVICQPKIAQKSYGLEKRFFSPPPLVLLRGNGWNLRASKMAHQGIISIGEDLKFGQQSMVYFDDHEVEDEPIASIGIVGSRDQERQAFLKWQKDGEGGRCAVQKLHIADGDNNRRKYFKFAVPIFYNKSGRLLGQFESKPIKVISKPTKRKNIAVNNNSGNGSNSKQTAADSKNRENNIVSGTEIALFSRVRSQTTNTRYLYANKNGEFVAHSDLWCSFTIYLADEENEKNNNNIPTESTANADDFHVRGGSINYGSIVKLVDQNHESIDLPALPMMRICKVEKEGLVSVEDSKNEQVSQLHKCAFQMVYDEKLFLCFTNDRIERREAQSFDEHGRSMLKDGAQWTIVSTDTTRYSFYEALGPARTQITPVPLAFSLELHASDISLQQNADDPNNNDNDERKAAAYVELQGRDLYPNLHVWIGPTRVKSMHFQAKDRIRFELPPLCDLLTENCVEGVDFLTTIHHREDEGEEDQEGGGEREGDFALEFPLLLAREDGVIYPLIGLSVSYSRPTECGGNNCSGVNAATAAGVVRAQQMDL